MTDLDPHSAHSDEPSSASKDNAGAALPDRVLDVNALEVRHLVAELKSSGVKFEYKMYEDAPGGHYFNRLDTPLARQSREEIYRFLDTNLKH